MSSIPNLQNFSYVNQVHNENVRNELKKSININNGNIELGENAVENIVKKENLKLTKTVQNLFYTSIEAFKTSSEGKLELLKELPNELSIESHPKNHNPKTSPLSIRPELRAPRYGVKLGDYIYIFWYKNYADPSGKIVDLSSSNLYDPQKVSVFVKHFFKITMQEYTNNNAQTNTPQAKNPHLVTSIQPGFSIAVQYNEVVDIVEKHVPSGTKQKVKISFCNFESDWVFDRESVIFIEKDSQISFKKSPVDLSIDSQKKMLGQIFNFPKFKVTSLQESREIEQLFFKTHPTYLQYEKARELDPNLGTTRNIKSSFEYAIQEGPEDETWEEMYDRLRSLAGINTTSTSPDLTTTIVESSKRPFGSVVLVHCNVDSSAKLAIRGDGEGLTWHENTFLTQISGNCWALATNIDFSKVQAKIVKITSKGDVVWEQIDNNANRKFNSNEIQTCAPNIQGCSVPSEGKEEAKEQFFFKLAASPEDKLVVRGELGNRQQAIPLKFLGYDLWMLELACEPNKTMQFKILKGDAWERGPNRELTTGKNPSIVELKALQF